MLACATLACLFPLLALAMPFSQLNDTTSCNTTKIDDASGQVSYYPFPEMDPYAWTQVDGQEQLYNTTISYTNLCNATYGVQIPNNATAVDIFVNQRYDRGLFNVSYNGPGNSSASIIELGQGDAFNATCLNNSCPSVSVFSNKIPDPTNPMFRSLTVFNTEDSRASGPTDCPTLALDYILFTFNTTALTQTGAMLV